MKLEFMVLKDNPLDGDSNINDTWDRIIDKFKEESSELEIAINDGDRTHIAEEVQDVIQICIRIMMLLVKEKYDLIQFNRRHIKKLVKRGWKNSHKIKVFIERDEF